MSPTKKRLKNIKVHVPRHNSQRIGPALTAQIETIAKEKRIRTDVRQPTNEASSTIAHSIESASEWNSMLLTARAERGPQWDVGTQQFQVEEGSNLYYDPSPLLEYQKEDKQAVPNPAEGLPSSSSNPHPVQRGPPFPMAGHHSTNGVIMSPIVATPTRHGIPGQMGGPYGGPQFNAIPPVQFYGVDRNSPMTRGMSMGMGMEGMGITPDVRSLSRRM
ncbi:hypothetical protein BC827DRAFT_1205759 [Russula dissimulans]|nr:hypothetical protein BC827DRAFT_1205759 [Russula dissimulans]